MYLKQPISYIEIGEILDDLHIKVYRNEVEKLQEDTPFNTGFCGFPNFSVSFS